MIDSKRAYNKAAIRLWSHLYTSNPQETIPDSPATVQWLAIQEHRHTTHKGTHLKGLTLFQKLRTLANKGKQR